MTNTICLDKNYSTTRLLTQEKPEIINNPEEKFETVLFLPEGENRQGEGGLRTKGYFKKSYEDKPLISIITVVYNGEEFLEETIESVINQTYDNVEYIIIDGGSTDGTVDIIKKYEDKINYWISERDKGIYDAMNKGIKISNGEWVGIINADDWYEKDIFKLVVKNIQDNDCEILYGNMNMVDNNKALIKFKKAVDWKLYFGMSLNHPATFIKKTIYNNLLFDTSYKMAADYNFLLQLKIQSKNFLHLNEVLVNMRMGGVSEQQSALTQKEEQKIKKYHLGYFFYLSNLLLKIKKALK